MRCRSAGSTRSSSSRSRRGVAVGLLAEPLRSERAAPEPEGVRASRDDQGARHGPRAEARGRREASSAPVRPDAYPAGSEVGKAWEAAAEAIYYWDEQIQDGLGVSAELLAAYQLGRGLAEAFWALDPDAPEPGTKPSVTSTLSPLIRAAGSSCSGRGAN